MLTRMTVDDAIRKVEEIPQWLVQRVLIVEAISKYKCTG